MNPLNASQSTVCGLAWKRYPRQTPLRDVAPALNGRASLARLRPCRTGVASFMVARARGRARRRAMIASHSMHGAVSGIRLPDFLDTAPVLCPFLFCEERLGTIV